MSLVILLLAIVVIVLLVAGLSLDPPTRFSMIRS
jgi:hypothetical protein